MKAALVEARLQAHWAAQLPAAMAHAVAERRDDWSHTALTWRDGMLVTVDLEPARRPKKPWSVGLDLAALTLVVLVDGMDAARIPLQGSTLTQALTAVQETAQTHTGVDAEPELFAHDMPEHALADDGRFAGADPAALAELSAWYAAAHTALLGIADGAPVRCWPHHFDLATLQDLGEDGSVNIGMTPGDPSYDHPYWSVSPWPYPKARPTPPLPAGHWHTEGWYGAVLVNDRDPKSVGPFLEAAVAAARQLLA